MTILRAAAAAAGLFAAGCATPAAELDLIERHTRAVGGAAAIEAVEAIEVEVFIEEPDFSLDGLYRARRDGRMRVDVFAEGERVFSEGLDRTAGWQLFGGEEAGVDVTPEGEAALHRGVLNNLFGVHELASHGAQVRQGEPVEIDGVSHPTIAISYADGFETLQILDPQTHLVARTRGEYALHPDLDPTQRRLETLYSDHREVDGIIRPFLQETVDMDTGETTQTVTVRAVRINPVIDDTIFERP